jgi:hypothetical protein
VTENLPPTSPSAPPGYYWGYPGKWYPYPTTPLSPAPQPTSRAVAAAVIDFALSGALGLLLPFVGLGLLWVSADAPDTPDSDTLVGAVYLAFAAAAVTFAGGMLLLCRSRLARTVQVLATLVATAAALTTVGLQPENQSYQVLFMPIPVVLLIPLGLVLSKGATKPTFRHDQGS